MSRNMHAKVAGITARHDRPKAPSPAFITLEGIDGCGKSTQARLLAATLEHAGYEVELLREPGGAAISEKIRQLLLDPANAEMSATCELMLYEAARAQLVHQLIVPALQTGRVVVCDRFYDSTTSYQSFGSGIDRATVDTANGLAVGAIRPLITIVCDIAPDLAAERMPGRARDRMEAKGAAFQQRAAEGFRAIAAEEPERVRLIDASEDVAHVLLRSVAELIAVGFQITDTDAHVAFTAAYA
ncbi:thymidylate kinase [Coriobacterium glomerans PW2]|uniref:Thymidylate kinase n=1 Tax=Coriobacterium glomerans (strain ATCC 49209 / DSM 20642 / JCM 10262 / PW2) TaxID=700015 RepID=F2N772_CORGP|nr:dTMP kinase [Coriobacterium glomerans]AEB06547.1 thymidylate kinase [Coriobacterium glomerans PW2]